MKQKNSKYLEKYEADLITARYHQYTRQLPLSVLQEFNRIYEEESGQALNTNFGCGQCILNLVKHCASLYFTEFPQQVPEDLRDRKI